LSYHLHNFYWLDFQRSNDTYGYKTEEHSYTALNKAGVHKFQWEFMKGFGLSDEDIAKFQDSHYWVDILSSLAKKKLKVFGLGCDWKRLFIMTGVNPFYNALFRW
jgi:leucyl-tRNA synthetase